MAGEVFDQTKQCKFAAEIKYHRTGFQLPALTIRRKVLSRIRHRPVMTQGLRKRFSMNSTMRAGSSARFAWQSDSPSRSRRRKLAARFPASSSSQKASVPAKGATTLR